MIKVYEKIKPIKTKIRQSDSIGIFHDSKSDIRMLAKVLNEVIDKVNEIISKII